MQDHQAQGESHGHLREPQAQAETGLKTKLKAQSLKFKVKRLTDLRSTFHQNRRLTLLQLPSGRNKLQGRQNKV
jgi:hypothetical protein